MNKIIFTDLDGTLTLRDTYNIFIFHNLNFSSVLKNAMGLTTMTLKYLFGALSREGVKRASFKMFFDGYDAKKDIGDFLNKIPWNSPVVNMINAKKEEGYKVILVTASPDLYLPYICDYLNYDGFIATKTLREGDVANGIFDGEVCNYEEKPKRIQEFLGEEKTSHTISYGNSAGDHAMLRFCDESYFVHKANVKKF